MKASLVPLALLLAACPGSTPQTCDIESYNLDKEIDGMPADEGADGGLPEGFEATDVKLCATGEGRVYAVWKDAREGFGDVWLNVSQDAGLTWQEAPTRIKQGQGNATGVDMACQGDRVYVAWEDDRDGETGYQNIYLNFSADGGVTWQAEDIALDADPDGTAISLAPQIGLFEGKVYVSWYDQREGAPDIYLAASANGGKKWQEPLCVSCPRDGDDEDAGVAWSGNPYMVIDDTGRIYVAWEDTRNGKNDIYFSASGDQGLSFGRVARLDTGDTRGSAHSFRPRLGAAGGKVYAVWHDTRSGVGRDVFMNYSADGGNTWFDAAVRVETDTPGFGDSINPDLLVEGDDAHIVWQDNEFGGYDVLYRKAVAGVFGADSEPLRLDQDEAGSANSTEPRIARRDGHMAVVWRDFRLDGGQGFNDLYYAYYNDAGDSPGWVEEEYRVDSLDSLGDQVSFKNGVQLATVSGELFTAWIDGRRGAKNIYFSRLVLGEPVDSYADYNACLAQGGAQ